MPPRCAMRTGRGLLAGILSRSGLSSALTEWHGHQRCSFSMLTDGQEIQSFRAATSRYVWQHSFSAAAFYRAAMNRAMRRILKGDV